MKVTITFDFNLDTYNTDDADNEQAPSTIEEALDDIKINFEQIYADPKDVGIANIQITHD